MGTNNNSDVVKEIFSATKYMIDASLKDAPFDKTVTGIVVGGSNKKNYYQVMIYGKNYELPSYINNVLKPNIAVNVMVPQNNMDFAFIYSILGGEEKGTGGGGSGGHADTADYATRAGYADTVAVATTEVVGGILSSSGKNHVTVSSTGIATVDHVDKADTATDAQNAVNAQNAVHANNADNATQANSAINAQHANEANEAAHSAASDVAETVNNVPIATETKVGGIISSTGPGHVQVDENGVATVSDAGGIKEVPIATETVVGGVISSRSAGKLSVGSDGKASIVDSVLIKDSGVIEKPESFGEGPWKIIVTEDNNPDDPQTGLPPGGKKDDVLIKNSSGNYDTKWSDVVPKTTFATTAGNGVPAGGTDGQVLIKQGNSDYDTVWGNQVPAGGNPGQILQKSTPDNFAFQWINNYSNTNLLDNWYLPYPINETKIESGALWGSRYYSSIDRWHSFTRGTTKWVMGKGIVLTGNTLNSIAEQYFRYMPGFQDMPMTVSLLGYSASSVYSKAITMNFTYGVSKENVFEADGTLLNVRYLHNYYGEENKDCISIWNQGELDFSIYAIKLEYGTIQTLYYTDSNGINYLRDCVPNQATELAKCQRWRYVIPTATEFPGAIFNPPNMYFAFMHLFNMEPIRDIYFPENGSFYIDCNGNRKQCFGGTDFTTFSFAGTNLIKISINTEDSFFINNKLHPAWVWGLSDNLVINSEL